jgi:hypothetical protein
MASEKELWDNVKNVMRMGGCSWSGEVETRFNVDTLEEEYKLRLDFVNIDGWFSAKFILAEWKLYQGKLVCLCNINNSIATTVVKTAPEE